MIPISSPLTLFLVKGFVKLDTFVSRRDLPIQYRIKDFLLFPHFDNKHSVNDVSEVGIYKY